MSIAYGGIVAFFFRGLNLVVAGLTILITANELGDHDYGRFFFALTFVGIVNALTGGLTAAIAYQVANRRQAAGAAFVNGIASAALLGAAALLAGAVATFAGAGPLALAVGVAGAAVILNSVVAGVFLGRESLVRYNLALVLPPALSLTFVTVMFFAFGQRSPGAAMAAYALGQWSALALMAFSGAAILLPGLRFQPPLAGMIVRFALLAGVSSGISFLNYRADIFVVRHFEGDAGVGVYSLAVYIGESIWQVSGSLALATYARVGALTRAEAAELTTRVMRHSFLLLGLICAGLFAIAGLIQAVLFPGYEGMQTALRLLLPGVLLYGLAQSFSGFYTYQRGLPWVAALVAGTGLVVDLTLALLLVPRFGVNGAAAASSIAYSTAILAGLAVFLRRERISPIHVFRFGRADVADYRALVARVRSRLQPSPAPAGPADAPTPGPRSN